MRVEKYKRIFFSFLAFDREYELLVYGDDVEESVLILWTLPRIF